MKFDEALNYIAESTLDMEMAKPKNPAILAKAAEYEKKGLSPATAYAYARKDFLAGKVSNKKVAAVEPAISSNPGVKYKELPDTLRTKDAVANYMQHNPGATEEEVLSVLTSQNSEEAPYNLDPEIVKTAMIDTQSGGDEQEPDIDTIAQSEKAAKMARVKDALLRMRGLKGKVGRKPVVRDEPEEEPEELSGSHVDMRDEPIDPTEL
jgi:hypothetical protein